MLEKNRMYQEQQKFARRTFVVKQISGQFGEIWAKYPLHP